MRKILLISVEIYFKCTDSVKTKMKFQIIAIIAIQLLLALNTTACQSPTHRKNNNKPTKPTTTTFRTTRMTLTTPPRERLI